MCTLNPDHIFAQWFSGSVLQSSAIGPLLGIPNKINASRGPLVHLLSLAIISSVHSFLQKKKRKEKKKIIECLSWTRPGSRSWSTMINKQIFSCHHETHTLVRETNIERGKQ